MLARTPISDFDKIYVYSAHKVLARRCMLRLPRAHLSVRARQRSGKARREERTWSKEVSVQSSGNPRLWMAFGPPARASCIAVTSGCRHTSSTSGDLRLSASASATVSVAFLDQRLPAMPVQVAAIPRCLLRDTRDYIHRKASALPGFSDAQQDWRAPILVYSAFFFQRRFFLKSVTLHEDAACAVTAGRA